MGRRRIFPHAIQSLLLLLSVAFGGVPGLAGAAEVDTTHVTRSAKAFADSSRIQPQETRRRRFPFSIGVRFGPAFGDAESSQTPELVVDREFGYLIGMTGSAFPLSFLGVRLSYMQYFYDVTISDVVKSTGGDLRVRSYQIELLVKFREASEGPFSISAGYAWTDYGAEGEGFDSELGSGGSLVFGAGTDLNVARSQNGAMSVFVGASLHVGKTESASRMIRIRSDLPALLVGASYHF